MNSLILLCCLLLAACESPGPATAPIERLFDDAAFGPPSVRNEAADVLAISPRMHEHLQHKVIHRLRARSLQQGLVDALYRRGDLRPATYDTELTRNAAEAFDSATSSSANHRRARQHFERALDDGSDYHEFHFGLAQALVQLGEYERAARQLKQLCRYITRPALSDERVQLNAAGQVELKIKTRRRDGTTPPLSGGFAEARFVNAISAGGRIEPVDTSNSTARSCHHA